MKVGNALSQSQHTILLQTYLYQAPLNHLLKEIDKKIILFFFLDPSWIINIENIQ